MEIYSGIIHKAQKICVYGPEGIGKTTFASQAPDPLFIDLENGSLHLNVKRTQRPQNWAALLTAVAEVQKDPTLCRTLVIDTADKAETLCTQFVVEKKKVDSIESIGYGKGYVMVAEEFNKLLQMLENVSACGINVIITAHAAMRKFEQPDELGAYDRWELKLSKKVAPLVKEWVDALLFANYKTIVVTTGENAKNAKHKAQGGRRVMYTSHHPCWDAKNRWGLPDQTEFEWAAVADHVPGDAPAAKQEKVNTADDGLIVTAVEETTAADVYAAAEAKGYTAAQVDKSVFKSYGKLPAQLTEDEAEEVIKKLNKSKGRTK